MKGVTVLQRVGMAIDRYFLRKVGATSIPDSKLNLLLICFHPYKGVKTLTFPDGVTINPGDPVGEIHLANKRIMEISREQSGRSLEWYLLELFKEEFSSLAKACSEGRISLAIKGFYGVNVLTAGAKRLGFILVVLPKGWNRWWLGLWETILRKIFYSFDTKKKVTFQKTHDPFEVWLTRDELIRRYY